MIFNNHLNTGVAAFFMISVVVILVASIMEWTQVINGRKPIGSTEKNLVSAIHGETEEYQSMYPGFAKTARDEGFDDVAEWFETLAKAEKSHAGRFTKMLESLQSR